MEVGEDRENVHRHPGTEFFRSACPQAEGDRRVQMGSGVVGHNDPGVYHEAPSDIDHQESPVEPLVLHEGVRDHSGSQKHEHSGAHHFGEKYNSQICPR